MVQTCKTVIMMESDPLEKAVKKSPHAKPELSAIFLWLIVKWVKAECVL